MSSFTIQFKNILFGESIFKPCCLYLSLNRHIKWSPIVFLHFVYLLQPTPVYVLQPTQVVGQVVVKKS